MATRKVDLEPHLLDREYPQPFYREARYGDIVEFNAVDVDNPASFTIKILNQNGFFTEVDGSPAGDPITFTLYSDNPSNNSKQYKIANGPLAVPHKEYKVVWDQPGLSARRGDAPPKIIIVPISD